MSKASQIINIGIFAHVDAGKTTITERFLHNSGVIKDFGSVDKGQSQSDHLNIEKERGISVKSSALSFPWKGVQINVIDTPGHADFAAEVERSLMAIDCALLVISAVEGIQSYTSILWKTLRRLKKPSLIFINKLDRMGADTQGLLQNIEKSLSKASIALQEVRNEGEEEFELINTLDPKVDPPYEKTLESIISNDEAILEQYLDGESLSTDLVRHSLRNQVHQCTAYPILMGSAKLNKGMEELLDAILDFLPTANNNYTSELSAVVYKVSHDKVLGRMANIRLFGGRIQTRDSIYNATQDREDKVSQIRKHKGQQDHQMNELIAGDTATISGLSTVRAGDLIGKHEKVGINYSLSTPLLTVKVEPETNEDYAPLVKAMEILASEDPLLDLLWLKEERELHIKIMGMIQLEVLGRILEDRFHLKVNFDKPSVIYKERPKAAGEAFESYTMPKPCWAVVGFIIEPAEQGSGISFSSSVGVNQIARRYQQEIERTIPKALEQGNYGWEVTDLNIQLVSGEHHNIHSRAGDFAVATPMALLNGLKSIGTHLLEPILEFKIEGPEEVLGKIMGSLGQLRAKLNNPELKEEQFMLSGRIPLATSLDLPAKLGALSGGKAKLSSRFSTYEECPVELGATTAHRGVSPLDRAKYILKARKALQ